MLLDEIDALSEKIERRTSRVEELVGELPEAKANVDPETGEIASTGLPVLERLDEVPGIGLRAAQVIVAEIGT